MRRIFFSDNAAPLHALCDVAVSLLKAATHTLSLWVFGYGSSTVPRVKQSNKTQEAGRTPIATLHCIREWERDNLPTQWSIIALDIFHALVVAYLRELPVTIAALNRSLPYSENAVHTHVHALTRQGWITLADHASNTKCVVPTGRLVRLMEDYLTQIDHPIALRLSAE